MIKNRKYKDYQLLDVYQCASRKQQQQIVKLWRDNEILPPGQDPGQRVNEVAIAVVDASERVVGVSTVYIEHRPLLDEFAFMFRMFIQPTDRIPGMMIAVVNYTFDVLQLHSGGSDAVSMMIVSDNPKLMRPGTRRQLGRMGFTLLGQEVRGRDVWRRQFS